MIPAPSTLNTPADTPASTASVSRRRVSSSLLAATSSPRCCLDLAGHAVERARELAELVIGRPLLYADREIAAAHLLGGRHQAADWLGELGGEQNGEPHRRQQHQERDGATHQEDGELAALNGLADLGIELAGELDALDVVDDPQVDGMSGPGSTVRRRTAA